MVCVYVLKNSPAVLFCHQELLCEYPVNAGIYSSAFTVPSSRKSACPCGMYNALSQRQPCPAPRLGRTHRVRFTQSAPPCLPPPTVPLLKHN